MRSWLESKDGSVLIVVNSFTQVMLCKRPIQGIRLAKPIRGCRIGIGIVNLWLPSLLEAMPSSRKFIVTLRQEPRPMKAERGSCSEVCFVFHYVAWPSALPQLSTRTCYLEMTGVEVAA